MKRITIFFLVAFSFIFLNREVSSQEYLEMMSDSRVNVYDVQKKFEEYWKGREYVRGKGWKQYKRWEEFMIPRTYPTGERFDPSIAYTEYQRYMENYINADNQLFGDWQPMGPTSWVNGLSGYNPGNGRINCVQVDPNNPNIVYVGAPAGGIWKSTDNGSSWIPLSDNFTVLGVSSIAIHPSNSNVIYIATGDGDGGQTYSIGILKSIDGGVTWTTTGLSFVVSNFTRLNKLIINPNDPNMIIAAGNNGIYKSTNAGENWNQSVTGINVRDLEFKPGDPNIVYGAGVNFWKSTNAGTNFISGATGVPISGITRIAIGVSSANSNYVYLLASGNNGGFQGYYRSTNSGTDFTLQSSTPNILGYELGGTDPGGQGTYDLVNAVSPTDINTVYTGGINIWKSTDAGVTWEILTSWYYPNFPAYGYVHADIHFLEFFGSRLITGSDGGVHFSTDNGANWTDKSTGLNIMQFYKIGGTPQNANLLIGGTQDNGSNVLRNGILTHIFGADGGEAIIDYTDTNIMYCEYQNGGILKSVDGGENLTDATNGITENGGFVTPYVMHPTDNNILFAGFQNVWKTTNGAASWVSISSGFAGGSITALSVAPSNPDYIYAAKGPNLYSTTNGGVNWTNINAGLSGLAITYITIKNTDPNTIWITNSAYSAGNKVFKTTNRGTNWTNISGTLPNLPANCITYEIGPKEGLYVGMDVGVYYTNNQLSGWIPYMDNLPNVIVREFEIHYGTNKVRAGTLGRGIWEATLASVIVGVENNNSAIPNNYNLRQNYPNPFNPSTQITFDMPKEGQVSLKIYDGLGREVASLFQGTKPAGRYDINFDGSGLSSGAYFYRLEVSNQSALLYAMTKKMILLK